MPKIEKEYAEYVYDIMKRESVGMDAIYQDFIIHTVGVFGFDALFDAKLIEGCGVVNGRNLYTLVDKK